MSSMYMQRFHVASEPNERFWHSMAVILMIFVVAMLPLLSTPVLPFIDYYNHLARFHVLANLAGDIDLARNYTANWALLPNIALDVMMTTVTRWLEAAGFGTAVGHVMVVALMAMQYGGILAFNRALTGRLSVLVALLTVPLLYSFIMVWGFANFLAGLAMVFWAAAWWLWMRHRLVIAVPVACALAAFVFLVHGLAFALYGVLLGMLEIGIFWLARERSIGQLLGRMAGLAIQAVVPILIFTSVETSKAVGGITNADESWQKLEAVGRLWPRLMELANYRMVTIVQVAQGPSLLFDAISFVITVGLLIMLLRRGHVAITPFVLPALAVGVLLVLFVPPALFNVGYVADRMPLFFAMLLVGSLHQTASAREGNHIYKACLVGLAVLVSVRLIVVAADWNDYGADDADFRTVAAQVPSGSLTNFVALHPDRLERKHRRCEMYGPRLIAERGAISPLFADPGKQPLGQIGPLGRAVSNSRGATVPLPRPTGYYDDILARTAVSGFDMALICDADALTRPLPAGSILVARQGRFALVRFAPSA